MLGEGPVFFPMLIPLLQPKAKYVRLPLKSAIPSGKALQRPRETFDIRAANGFSMQLLEVVDVLNFRDSCL